MKVTSDQYSGREQAKKRRPAEVIRFWTNSGSEWTYTGADAPIVFGGKTYTCQAIKRSKVKFDSKFSETRCTFEMDPSLEPVTHFEDFYPPDIYWVSAAKVFLDMDPMEGLVSFLGMISTVNYDDVAAAVVCAGFERYLKQQIPIDRCEVTCNAEVFDSRCDVSGAVAAAHPGVNATVTVLAGGLVLQSASFLTKPSGYFTRGWLVKGSSKVMITDHTGNTIYLRHRLRGLETGNSVTVYAGCDKMIRTCRDKFNNVINFRGFPYIPLENPAARD